MACRPACGNASGVEQFFLVQPMADVHSNAGQPAGARSSPGYNLPNKATPLPRQWQLPQPQKPVPRSQGSMQHFYPESPGAGDWRQAVPSRRMERATLLGLWLLVMLAAIAIGLRMFDLSTIAAPPAEPPARAPVSADAAHAMRSAALATARPDDSDPFDDIAPLPPQPLPEHLPAPPPMPAPPMPATRLTPAATLAIERPATPQPAATRRASREPVCADAIRAMQLCPD
jgi:hypothetical protein